MIKCYNSDVFFALKEIMKLKAYLMDEMADLVLDSLYC
jgi:hypothetical protein